MSARRLFTIALLSASFVFAQDAPAFGPVMAGPLEPAAPAVFDSGPLGQIGVSGVATGLGVWTGNYAPGDRSSQTDLGNGQIFVQKTSGRFQFFFEAGAYNIPSLGTPFLRSADTVTDLWGPVPVAYVKLEPWKNTSILAGALPTLLGAEYVFTFQNLNVSRGLLTNQENAVNRGVQVNRTIGRFTASLSWNDGFHSNRYSWLGGSLAYASGPHSVTFVAMGDLGRTAFRSSATPVQNNGSISNLIYTYTKGRWIAQSYLQHSDVPANPKIGVATGASTNGGAILLSRKFRHGFALPVRWEYIAATGTAAGRALNLLFGPGSEGMSATVTPTFQHNGFFVRGDLAWVHASGITPGNGFGGAGRKRDQPRALLEAGFLLGNNIAWKKR